MSAQCHMHVEINLQTTLSNDSIKRRRFEENSFTFKYFQVFFELRHLIIKECLSSDVWWDLC